MAAITTFQFGKYTLRPPGEGDIKLAVEWTEKDPFHRLTTLPKFWMEQTKFIDSYLLLDNEGPVFFIRIDQSLDAACLHIQFMPMMTHKESQRTMLALMRGLEWLERILVGNAIKTLFFDSENSNLIRFSVTRLGFTQTSETRLEKRLIRG